MAVKGVVYGLGLQINVPFDALVGLPQPEKIDVYVEVANTPAIKNADLGMFAEEFYVSSHCDAQGVPEFRASRLSPGGCR